MQRHSRRRENIRYLHFRIWSICCRNIPLSSITVQHSRYNIFHRYWLPLHQFDWISTKFPLWVSELGGWAAWIFFNKVFILGHTRWSCNKFEAWNIRVDRQYSMQSTEGRSLDCHRQCKSLQELHFKHRVCCWLSLQTKLMVARWQYSIISTKL